jgi:hypothetical protein
LCILHTISHGTTQPGIIYLCLLQEISSKGAFAKARLLVSPLCVMMPTSILIAKFSFGKWLYKIRNDRFAASNCWTDRIIKYEIFMVTKCNEVWWKSSVLILNNCKTCGAWSDTSVKTKQCWKGHLWGSWPLDSSHCYPFV